MNKHSRIEKLWDAIEPLDGWDFSRIRSKRGSVPWNYDRVVRDQLAELQHPITVLDIGTGGGEKLIQLGGHFDRAIGVDPDPKMINAATINVPDEAVGKFRFVVGAASNTGQSDRSFDCVLNRHAVVDVAEIERVLRPGGLFITQQVGGRNLEGLLSRFGGQNFSDDQSPEQVRADLDDLGMNVDRYDEYDVEYRYLDLESVLFQIKAIESYLNVGSSAPDFFDRLEATVEAASDGNGEYVANEHRWLIVARKG